MAKQAIFTMQDTGPISESSRLLVGSGINTGSSSRFFCRKYLAKFSCIFDVKSFYFLGCIL